MVTRVPDVTRIVDRLEKAGLVKRRRSDEDKRVVLVSITRKGLAKLDDLDRPVRDLHARQMGHVPRKDLERFSRLHEKVRRLDA